MPAPSALAPNLYRGSAFPTADREISEAAWRSYRPRPVKRILFASAHSIVDSSNGASVATLDALYGLRATGFECQAFCSCKLDFKTDVRFEDVVTATGEPHQVRPTVCGPHRAQILYMGRHNVPITIVRLASTRHGPERSDDLETVQQFFQKFLDVYRPEVMLTYGGEPITLGMIGQAKQRSIPIVVALHNFAYVNSPLFAGVDYCLVASQFARRHYRDNVGLDCHALSYPIDWDRVRVEKREPSYVAFVNPCLEKGVYAFARIAHELGRRRPDIPLVVVESRGTKEHLAGCGLDLAAAGNVRIMAHATGPRRFWRLTKIALLPSLWWENQPLVAIEAMINGIPVIGSNRGGIPETLGNAGIVLPLPDRLTPTTQIVPGAIEVEPWVETIIRLWDDQDFHAEQSALALNEAERWRPDRLRPLYADFFRNARRQPGAPVISKDDRFGARAGPAGNGTARVERDGL
jgi:glycosyltransferase involved in cell wall biosynthesis